MEIKQGLTYQQLATALNVSLSTVKKYAKATDAPQRINGKHDLKLWQDYLVKKGFIVDPLLMKEKAELEKIKVFWQGKSAQLAYEREAGKVIDINQYQSDLLTLTSIFKSAIETISKRMISAFRDNPEIKKESEKIERDIMESVSQGLKSINGPIDNRQDN